MKRLLIALMVAMICVGGSWAAEPAAPDPKLLALKKELADLMKQREDLRRAIEQGEAVATLRKVREDTAREYAEIEKNDAGFASARKAMQEAQGAYDTVLRAKAAASPEGAKLLQQRADLEERRQALMFQDDVAQVKLQSAHSPVQRALDKDAELAGLYKAYHAIDPKEKAARDAARQKYEETRKARLAALPEAKTLADERAKIKSALADLEIAEKDIEAGFKAVRDELRKGQDAELKAASDKIAAAQKATAEAQDSNKLKAAREAARTASKVLRDRLSDLLAADPKAKELTAAIESKSAQVGELQKKAKEK